MFEEYVRIAVDSYHYLPRQFLLKIWGSTSRREVALLFFFFFCKKGWFFRFYVRTSYLPVLVEKKNVQKIALACPDVLFSFAPRYVPAYARGNTSRACDAYITSFTRTRKKGREEKHTRKSEHILVFFPNQKKKTTKTTKTTKAGEVKYDTGTWYVRTSTAVRVCTAKLRTYQGSL